MNSLLTLKNISYHRGHFALKIDRLDLCEGKIYLLEGPNGAGKSSLLHLLAQLLTPEAGDVVFGGKPVADDADRQRLRQQITLVEQTPFLFDCSVFDNLAFGLRLRDVQGDLQRHRIRCALQRVGMEAFESRRAKELSGGEARRVALARALVLQPKVLLLDETIAGLDQDALALFEDLLNDLSRQGVAAVIASHDAWRTKSLKVEPLHLLNGQLLQYEGSTRSKEKHQCQSA